MREIKFRAWSKIFGEMEYWEPFKYNDNDFIENEEYKDNVMQYIGLKDKTGKEFYKGDIGEFDNGDRFFIDCEKWLEFFVSWIGEPKCEDQARDLYRIERSKIIGNKHENKELLNGTS